MSFKSVVALFIMALVLVCLPAMAQQPAAPKEKTFKLLRDKGAASSAAETSKEEEEVWVPGIRKGAVEVSFSLGMLDLKSTLLAHDQIIYKYNDEATFWGDMRIEGQSAFNPMMRIGYNLSPWLSLEAIGAFSFSEYGSKMTNRHRRSNETGSPVDFDEPALGEFDLETRSLLTANAGVNAVVYFLNMSHSRQSRFHPYATGGIGNVWYSMNSNYVEKAATSLDLNFGGGFRLLADENVSIRVEATYHLNSVEFTPSEYFTERNEGTIKVPLDEFPVEGEVLNQRQVQKFASQSVGSLGLSIGLQGSF